MGHLWKLIEHHQDSTPYGASVREIARGAGIKESTLPRWQNLKRMPEPEHLRALARQINVPYRVILDAALTDTGYLDARAEREDVGPDVRAASTRRAGESPAEDDEGAEVLGLPSTRPLPRAARKGKKQLTDEPGDGA